jgi:PKD repeat protein
MKTILQKSLFISCLFIVAIWAGNPYPVHAQPAIHVTIGNYTATTPGEYLYMPITVTNMPNTIASISMSLLFDPNVITYMADTLVNPGFAGGFFLTNITGSGSNYLLAWFGISPFPLTGTQQLATLKFQYNGGSCNLTWDTLTGGQTLYANINGIMIPAVFVSGTVNGGSTVSCSNSISYTTTGNTVSFTGNTTGGTAPYDYTWYFGDGTTSSSQNPTHTYAQAGIYNVGLSTMDTFFCYAVSSAQIPVSMSSLDGCIDLGVPLDTGSVVLYNQNVLGGGFSACDTVLINECYTIPNILPGNYLLKAMPVDVSAFWYTHLPTYFGNTPFWTLADTISTLQLNNPYNITLIYAFQPLAGPGNIGGVVTNGFKFTTSGIPAPGIEVLLTDMTDQVLMITYSDANGEFSFDNLAYGSYKVRAEVTSIPVVPWVVTLSAASPVVDYLHISITPGGILTSVQNELPDSPFSIDAIYPSPAANVLNLDIRSADGMPIVIEFMDVLGQRLMSRTENLSHGVNHLVINTEGFNPGLCFMRLLCSDGKTLQMPVLIAR